MDRRTFLKSSTAAAAIPAGAAVAANLPAKSPSDDPAGRDGRAPLPAHRFRVAIPHDALSRDQAERVFAQITTAGGGTIAIEWQETPTQTGALARQLRSGEIDAAFAVAPDVLEDPGLALFTGLPGRFGLGPENLLAWHAVQGAGAYLDVAAADHGVKILLAGHTGPRPGLWADRDITDLRDAAATRMAATGLGPLVWDRIQAPFSTATEPTIHAREFLADPACALRDARASGLNHVFRDGLHDGGVALSLVFSATAWARVPQPTQALIETAARAALHEAIMIATHHNQVVIPALTKAGTLAPRPLPDLVRKAIDHACLDVVDAYVARDERFAPAWAAVQAFHHQVTGRRFPIDASVRHTA